MGVRSRTLEITVISGENLRVTEDAYVVVRAESLTSCTTKTAAKDDGSNFLCWNEKFALDMPMRARSITFEVQCNRFKGSRPLGVARVATADFLAATSPDNQLQVLSYGLRDWEGKRNGAIHFAVRVAPPTSEERFSLKPAVEPKGCGGRIDVGDKNSNEVVVGGIPVWWNN